MFDHSRSRNSKCFATTCASNWRRSVTCRRFASGPVSEVWEPCLPLRKRMDRAGTVDLEAIKAGRPPAGSRHFFLSCLHFLLDSLRRDRPLRVRTPARLVSSTARVTLWQLVASGGM